MRVAFAAVLTALLAAAPAHATCKFGPLQLNGALKNRVTRSLTLTPGTTVIGLNAVGWDRQLSFKVLRPDGSEVCRKGPGNSLRCAVEVTARNQGSYPVKIVNPSGRRIEYWLTCNDE